MKKCLTSFITKGIQIKIRLNIIFYQTGRNLDFKDITELCSHLHCFWWQVNVDSNNCAPTDKVSFSCDHLRFSLYAQFSVFWHAFFLVSVYFLNIGNRLQLCNNYYMKSFVLKLNWDVLGLGRFLQRPKWTCHLFPKHEAKNLSRNMPLLKSKGNCFDLSMFTSASWIFY